MHVHASLPEQRMANENNFFIRKIDSTDPYSGSGTQSRNKRRQKQKINRATETIDPFKELVLSAEHAHELLRRTNSPYRFSVYREAGEVYIDLVVVGARGKVEKVVRKSITPTEFSDMLNRIESLDGFLVDCTA
jgi:uncharacterized FlaG/YvyC family protein